MNVLKITKKTLCKQRVFLIIPGDDLLSHAGFPRNIIGAIGLNCRVRNGNGCYPYAIVAGIISKSDGDNVVVILQREKFDKVVRDISTAQLNMLPYLHLQPINVVVFNDPYYLAVGRSYLGSGFALICFQRLSFPNIATQRCH